jgi:hypothetical protein
MAELIVRTRDSKTNIIGITEIKPKLNRYKPALAKFSLPFGIPVLPGDVWVIKIIHN